MATRKIAVTVGALFILQMVSAIFGTTLTQAFIAGDPDRGALTAGVALMMVSGLAVVAIGLLMYQVLKGFNQRLAIWYPIMRILEFTVSAACGIYLLTQLHEVPYAMLWIYIPTGIGGLILTYLLLASRLVPRPIAVLGLLGYAMLLLGVPLELLTLVDMDAAPGMLLLAPGGLFEVLILPAWLITKGFTPAQAPRPAPSSRLSHEPRG